MSERRTVQSNNLFWRVLLEAVVRPINRRIFRPLAEWSQREATIAQLSALDDALLADIGLSRGQIPQAVDDMMRHGGGTASGPAAYRTIPPPEPLTVLRRAA